jgi:hypothetical protein
LDSNRLPVGGTQAHFGRGSKRFCASIPARDPAAAQFDDQMTINSSSDGKKRRHSRMLIVTKGS